MPRNLTPDIEQIPQRVHLTHPVSIVNVDARVTLCKPRRCARLSSCSPYGLPSSFLSTPCLDPMAALCRNRGSVMKDALDRHRSIRPNGEIWTLREMHCPRRNSTFSSHLTRRRCNKLNLFNRTLKSFSNSGSFDVYVLPWNVMRRSDRRSYLNGNVGRSCEHSVRKRAKPEERRLR